jgi:hypothetical protein
VIRPGETQTPVEAQPIVLPIHELPDLRIARQPRTGAEAAEVALAYADQHSPSRSRYQATARAAYRTVVAYDAAALIGNAESAPNQSYGLGLADLHAVMRREPSPIDVALADR